MVVNWSHWVSAFRRNSPSRVAKHTASASGWSTDRWIISTTACAAMVTPWPAAMTFVVMFSCVASAIVVPSSGSSVIRQCRSTSWLRNWPDCLAMAGQGGTQRVLGGPYGCISAWTRIRARTPCMALTRLLIALERTSTQTAWLSSESESAESSTATGFVPRPKPVSLACGNGERQGRSTGGALILAILRDMHGGEVLR